MDRRKFLGGTGAAIAVGAANLSPLKALAESSNREIPGYGRSQEADPQPLQTQSNDLTPYTGAWTDATLMHLLRRAMMGVPYSQFVAAKGLGSMNAVVAKLLADTPAPAKPGTWVDTIYNTTNKTFNYSTDPGEYVKAQNVLRLNRMLTTEMENWWLDLMLKENLSIREKMTLMWSNHFVIGTDAVKAPPYPYTYNVMLRRNVLGNLKTFVYEMSIDPGMLIYLNGNQNTYQIKNNRTINNVNENFGRELMELFTLGLYDPKTGEPNYTETDIQQAAKALSGWQPTQTAPFVGKFNNLLHNNEQKTFFGQTGNFGLQEILDIIFAKGSGYNVAYYICQKIYMNFVYYVPNPTVVDAMANKLIASNWEIKSVMDALLKSAHFYDVNVPGAQLKSPVELACSLFREFNITLPAFDGTEPPDSGKRDAKELVVFTDPNPSHSYISTFVGFSLGQELLNPPNVKGWNGGHSWVNTGTLPTRKGVGALLVYYPNYYNGNAPRAKGVKFTFDPMAWAKEIPNADSLKSGEISNALADAVLSFDLGPIESELIRQVISGGVPEVDFYLDNGKIATMAQVLVTLPEFQLV